jgi:hypothetical protein
LHLYDQPTITVVSSVLYIFVVYQLAVILLHESSSIFDLLLYNMHLLYYEDKHFDISKVVDIGITLKRSELK